MSKNDKHRPRSSGSCVYMMMGKLHSKCDFNLTLEDNIWKKKLGFNLANYTMDDTLSELSMCLEEKSESSPLRVDLPPPKLETGTSKVLRLDHIGIRQTRRHNGRDKNKLDIEEFDCGIQFKGSDTAKQEWSFTLYDFDGHGRVTKEDFASLLKALNDAVGSSIKLPPNGARTLKLCLSVGQDGGMTSLQEPQSQQLSHRDTSTDCFGSSNKNNSINYFNNSKKNNVSVVAEHTSNVALRAPEGRRNRGLAPPQKAREFSKLNNLTGSAADEQTHQKQQVKRTNETRNQPGRVASLPSAIQLAPPPSVCSTSGLRDRVLFISAGLPHAGSSTKAALKGTEHTPAVLSSVQNRAQATCSAQVMTEHKRLADLVRENMERNRVRQQHRHLGNRRMEADRHRYLHHYCNHYTRQHRRRHQLVTAAAAPSKTHCSVASAGPHLSTSITALEGEREKLYSAGRHRSQGAGDAIRSSFKCEGKTGYSGCRIRPNVCELEHDFRSSNDENDSHDILECERSDYTKTCKENRNCDRVNDRKEIKVERRARNNFFIEPKKDKTGRPEHIAITKRQENRAEESQDRRNYYLDLAGVENTSSRLQNNSRSSHAHAGCSRRRHRGHHRSRSHDLATFHLPGSADAKFASGPSCDAANNFLNSDKEKECLCKNTITDKCENLLFSAVAFGLSLAAETPQAAEKCDTNIERQEEHTRVGNNVVQMVTTSSNKVLEEEPRNKDHYHYAEQMLIRAQSKVFDPYDVARESGEQEERKHYIRKQQNFHQDDDKTGARSSSIRILQDSMRTTENSKQVHYSQNGCDSAAKDTMRDNSNYCRGRPLSLSGHAPVCVSPHPHRRHRHRDKDYSQAMRQVAQWIEQEQHAWDQEAGAAAALGDKIPVQRHEHHHIHEHHHHHHYHHYHET